MQVITALSTAISTPVSDIVYVPEGEHTINASVNGEPKTFISRLNAEEGEGIAKSFNDQLKNLNAQNVRTFLDFDHVESGPAAGLPKSFRYDKGRGLILELEWTGAGKKAIEAKDYSYFSPTVLMTEDGTPAGLPAFGPLGGLVNNPAFRNIERIAAAQAQVPIEPKTKNNTQKTMSNTALVKAGVLNESEAGQADALTIATARLTSLKASEVELKAANSKVVELTAQNQTLTNKLEEQEVSKAKTIVAAAVKAGRLDPKDETSQAFWEKQLIADPEGAEKVLNSIQAKNEGVTDSVITTGPAKSAPKGEHSLITAANQLVEAGNAKDQEEALVIIASNDPAAYKSYTDSLGL